MAGGLAVGQPLAGFGTLHVVEPELGAHLHAVLAGDGATFVSALNDAQALVRGQQVGKKPIIGLLGPTTASVESQRVAGFVERLGELGWIEGRNIVIEYRWAEGRNERYSEIAAEFARLGVDVIVTQRTAAIMAAKRATSIIPIVFAAAYDPVATGIVASLARPGGNVTGLSQATDLATKRLQFLNEVVPAFGDLAIIVNIGNSGAVLEMHEVQTAATKLGVKIVTLEIQRAEDIAQAFETLRDHAQALYVCVEPLVNSNRDGAEAGNATEKIEGIL